MEGGETKAKSPARWLPSALIAVYNMSGLERAMMDTRSADDMQVAVLPAGIDEPGAIASLVNALLTALHDLNSADSAPRVRLRMAVHEGLTILAAQGFTGRAVTTTRRLADCKPLRQALAANPDADLAVILSSQVFDDVSQFSDPLLPADRFQRADVTHLPDGHGAVGWIYVPQPSAR